MTQTPFEPYQADIQNSSIVKVNIDGQIVCDMAEDVSNICSTRPAMVAFSAMLVILHHSQC